MAPQQNSTLIDDNLGSCPSMINIPEEISRYSPILPPKNKQNHDTNNNNNSENENDKSNYCSKGKNNNNTNSHQQDVNYVRNWEQTEGEKRHYHKYKHHHRSGSYRSGHSRRSRSISLYGVNSTIEQGHKEITIWLGDEPRYVSGVTNKTTCNDIIKALIDDEIRCGNYEYCQLSKDGTASRDYSDYVITECWRGIERSYDGNMAILPVWKAWSRVHNEIRLSLKHHKDIQDPSRALKTNTTLSSIRHYICKLLKFGKRRSNKATKAKPQQKSNNKNGDEKKSGSKKGQEEIMLVLMPPQVESDSIAKAKETEALNSNIKPTNEASETQAKSKVNKDKLYRLSEGRSTQRKRRSSYRRKEKRNTKDQRQQPLTEGHTNYLRRRKDSTIRSSVRNKLAQKNAEMNELYEREYALTKELTSKCKLYNKCNELYQDRDLEMSVGQIQHSIENYAKEIIRTEHALLAVKNEIKQDISIINNLKRLTLATDPNDCGVPIDIEKIIKPETQKEQAVICGAEPTTEQMQFVDNIYEFCDNNASMLV